MSDLIDRQNAIDAICKACQYDEDDYTDCEHREPNSTFCDYMNALRQLTSAEPEDWMERNKERILQAGMEGREIEFRIGGRLFAIREKAQ